MKKFFAVILFAIPVITSYDRANNQITQAGQKQKTINGKIISDENEGISSAYVYVVAGEEETLSSSNGNFSLKTWQPLPLTLVIEHNSFGKQKFLVKDASASITIKLSDRKN